MTEDVLTFEELRRAQTRERDTDTLQELDDDFFNRARNYLEMKRDPDSHLENREYRNARNILEDLLDMRQKKIVRLAFLAVKSDVQVEHLLEREEELFTAVRENIDDYRSGLHDDLFTIPPDGDTATDADQGQQAAAGADTVQEQVEADEDADQDDTEAGEGDEPEHEDTTAADETQIFGGDGDAGDDADDVGADNDAEEGAAAAQAPAGSTDAGEKEADDEREEDDGEDELETVVITQDVSEFMGVDLNAYGPYKEGDEAAVPAKNAQVLVDQDKARRE